MDTFWPGIGQYDLQQGETLIAHVRGFCSDGIRMIA
jgi:hypothetical protein